MDYITLDGLASVGRVFNILIVESPLAFPVITHDERVTLLFIPREFNLVAKGRVLGECIRNIVNTGKVSAA